MIFDLPTKLDIDGVEHPIRWEYRDILTILTALADPELDKQEKAMLGLLVFYPEAERIPPGSLETALEKMRWFIDGGQSVKDKTGPRVMDWEQDFPHIVAPVNRVIGREIRGPEPLHWWTFLSAYYEIGDCLFAQIVRIRDAQARGKKLTKQEREWARRNADLIRLETKYTEAETDLLETWTKGGSSNAE